MAKSDSSTRDRILRTAGELFYKEGVRGAGVDLIAEKAGLTKQTLYRYFPSKDALISAYLIERDISVRIWLSHAAGSKATSAAELVRGLFAVLGKWFESEGFRGCSFVNATVESGSSNEVTRAIAKSHKDQMRDWLVEAFAKEKRPNPQSLAAKIMILVDGAIASSVVQGNKKPALLAAEIADLILSEGPARRPRK
jgi:AcrR family transcriptional regulator